MRRPSPGARGPLGYAKRILGLHGEALLSPARTDLAGRILLGLTKDTTCSDLSRLMGRFRRLHRQVVVSTKFDAARNA